MRYDAIVLGAGGAGMMCAMTAGQRGKRVLLIDHADAPGKKILISGGGRCNFTNLHTAPDRYLSANPHFAKSALGRYSPQDFIALVDRHGIAWHEKTLGQLFCDDSARQIVDMLVGECEAAGVTLALGHAATVEHGDGLFRAAGGHLPVFLIRRSGLNESVEPMGPWCGIRRDIAHELEEIELQLEVGDLLCLITDGITEARSSGGQMFGEASLQASLREGDDLAPADALTELLVRVRAFQARQDDDMTAVLLKRLS